ncbi:hypothetical protein TorRG33x02_058910 [Trema orientale]|uniref:Uncharacterized protein n=1 Tax=Trema orientale TaxID=63057 RepID=A0A2P5FKN1_TREOI|nr:hypothetical protein TorRG33x02_058910 [Trema orientale]
MFYAIISTTLSKSELEFSWYIWGERNQRFHTGKQRTADALLHWVENYLLFYRNAKAGEVMAALSKKMIGMFSARDMEAKALHYSLIWA